MELTGAGYKLLVTGYWLQGSGSFVLRRWSFVTLRLANWLLLFVFWFLFTFSFNQQFKIYNSYGF